MEKVTYGGWPNCYRLASDEVELIVTADVGPRVIRFGFIGDDNEFAEFPEHMGQTGGTEWRIYGGHRLWHSPEDKERSYYPDNGPVKVEGGNGTLHATQLPEITTGILKEMVLRLGASNRVEVRHRLRNVGPWPVELAPWALSVMAPGGVGIVPQPTRAHPDGLLPNRVLVLWPYTDMTDPRLHWGSRFILLRQDTEAETPAKLGLSANDGWGAYLRDGHLFLKTYDYVENGRYPDHGCSLEMYTNDRMLELETLGPLGRLDPGDAVEHIEQWRLFRGVQAVADREPVDEESVARAVLPLLVDAKPGLAAAKPGLAGAKPGLAVAKPGLAGAKP